MRSFLFSALAVVPSLLGLAEASRCKPNPSCNTPENRACWKKNFNIETDYEVEVPLTGVTRHYTLEVSEYENWTGPDGVVKELAQLINGTFPGPVLTADWGDRLSITVVNNMKLNGTSFHWHGIRQLNSNLQDGVNGVTECPIPPGHSREYNFLAQQYGTTWYHSHFSAQYGNGVVGTIQINGPASANYDIDLGTFPVTDYYHHTADYLVDFNKNNGPPPSDNVLFNGTNVHPTTGAGAYANVTLKANKTHRLRIINTSVENHFVLSLAGHNFTIIATDLVPVQPTVVDQVFVAIGQRYDLLINATAAVDNYWFNASFVASAACGTSNNPAPAAIFHYEGADGGLPTDPGSVSLPATCTDLTDLSPVVARSIDTSAMVADASNELPVTLDFTQPGQLFTWRINGTKAMITWNKPVDEFLLAANASYPASDNVVVVNNKTNEWIFWVVENDPAVPIPHPIHLHGHDFVLLGRSDPSSSAAFTPADMATLSGSNPIRRDVAMLPAQGWMVIAYRTDNPGTWLMHCHIAWHVSGGLAVNFVERPEDFKNGVSAADKAAFESQCAAWNEYFPSQDPEPQQDSGLRRRRRSLGHPRHAALHRRHGVSARPIGVGSLPM